MSLQFQLIWCVLVVELGVFVLLVLPLPTRWKAQSLAWLKRAPWMRSVWHLIRIVFVLVLLYFAGMHPVGLFSRRRLGDALCADQCAAGGGDGAAP